MTLQHHGSSAIHDAAIAAQVSARDFNHAFSLPVALATFHRRDSMTA